ncbi:MAG: HAD family hydrolase [Deltaproteobacteria bacterium]|nr:HAD family hydrolase [Deltaproteobacteria bacterium]
MRPLFAFDVDGTLIDTRPSFTRIVRELSGASDSEVLRFRDTGGFNDDWELTRALMAWIGAGRPKIVERCESWRDVVAWCGHDPGDLSARCTALYRGGYWRDERVLLDGQRLKELEAFVDVVACTGRDAWEFDKGQELLGHRFASSTTMEQAKKPDPQALLRLLPSSSSSSSSLVVLFGDTHADRRTVSKARALRPDLRFAFVFVTEEHPIAAVVDAVLAERDPERVLAFAEPRS